MPIDYGTNDVVTEGTITANSGVFTNLIFTNAPNIGQFLDIDKNDIGLGNVDNTSDLNKPISTATQNALDTKAPINNPSFTGTVTGITKSMVGLGNVDNTSDLNKPISTAVQSSLNNKANSIHTHEINDITNLQTALDSKQPVGSYAILVDGKVPESQLPSYVDEILEFANQSMFPNPGSSDKIYVDLSTGNVFRWSGSSYINISSSPGTTDSIVEGTNNLYFTNQRASQAAPVQSVNTKTGSVTLNKNDIGLNNVDNTSDLNKPISTATQQALNAFSNVNNTSDLDKPISTATQNALNLKANLSHTHLSSDISDLSDKILNINTMGGRLSLISGQLYSSSGTTGSTLYYVRARNGDKVCLYSTITNKWSFYDLTELSLSLSGLAANSNFDIFIHNNLGTLTLTSQQWTNDTTRAIDLTTQNGIRVLNSDLNKRYVGTIRTTSTIGTCEDSPTRRFIWNYDNQVLRDIYREFITTNITTTSAAYVITSSNLSLTVLSGIGSSFVSNNGMLLIDHSIGVSVSSNIATDLDMGVRMNNTDYKIASAAVDNTNFQLIRGTRLLPITAGSYTIDSIWRRWAGTGTLRILGSSRGGYSRACTLTVYQWG